MDVGVSTGFYLAKSKMPTSTNITPVDLNKHRLNAAAERIKPMKVQQIQHNIFEHLPLSKHSTYDSISLFYPLQSLPRTLKEKEKAIGILKTRLSNSNTLYEAPILGDEAKHNYFGRNLIKANNEKGLFGNPGDTQDELHKILAGHFNHVQIHRQRRVALFTAKHSI